MPQHVNDGGKVGVGQPRPLRSRPQGLQSGVARQLPHGQPSSLAGPAEGPRKGPPGGSRETAIGRRGGVNAEAHPALTQ